MCDELEAGRGNIAYRARVTLRDVRQGGAVNQWGVARVIGMIPGMWQRAERYHDVSDERSPCGRARGGALCAELSARHYPCVYLPVAVLNFLSVESNNCKRNIK